MISPIQDRQQHFLPATATHLPTLRRLVARVWPATFLLTAVLIVLCAATPQAWGAAVPTTTTLTVTSAGSAVTTVPSKTVVTLTATVKAGSTAVNPGTVNFCDASAVHCTDIHLLATAQLTRTGTATFKFIPGIGSHSYKAVFLGTKGNGPSASSTAELTVTGYTTTTIALGGVARNYTLAATVGAVGSVAPTGTVSFLDTSNADAVLGTATLGTATASLNFVNSSNPATGVQPGPVAVGDFNGDGILDLAVANCNFSTCYLSDLLGSVTILLGNGDGTFTATATSPATGLIPDAIAVGDFNGDGVLDLAVANSGSNTVTVLLGNGDGTFTPTATSPAAGSPGSIAVGDFNGDGILDLAVVNDIGYSTPGSVTVLLGNGDGTFTPTTTSSATGLNPSAIAVGDFNGDGKADLAVENWTSDTVTILLGNGDGTFTATAVAPATGESPYAIAVGDFNGDGKADLAVANRWYNTLTILLGNGDGTFTATAASPQTGGDPQSIAAGDFNGDGILDLAVANDDPAYLSFSNATTVTLLLGNGDGTFTYAASLSNGGYSGSIAAGDFNGDGVQDMAVTAQNPDSVTVLLSQLTQTATTTPTSISLPPNTGTHIVEASYLGDINFLPIISAPIGVSTGALQTITFAKPSTQAYATPLTLHATVSSGLPVSFASTTPSVCTVSGNTVTFVATGTCTIQATQPGDSTYAPAIPVTQSFAVNPGAQTITFPNPGTQSLWTPITLIATASSGLPVSFYSGISYLVCSVSGNTLTFLQRGSCTIAADQYGNSDYAMAPEVDQTVLVTGTYQTITFANPGTQTYGIPLTLSASASSGLPVTFASTTPLVCTVSGNIATFVKTGTCGIVAKQFGTGTYEPAPSVGQIFSVIGTAQTITFANPGTQTSGAPLTLSATASSGLPVSFASTTTSICTVSGNTATFVITGTCTIQATQPGNTTYAAAPVVSQSFAVNRVTQTITFANPGTQTYGTPLTLRATASSGLPVSFVSTTTSVCTVSGNSVTFLKAGFCGIEAKQLGYGGLTPATPIGQIFSVIRATQAITFPAIPSTPFSTGSITLNATASSGLTVTYTSTTSPVCTVSGNTVTLLTGGTCGIAATQPGNGDYAAAPAVGRIFSVTRVTQTITFPAIPSTPLSAGPITLAATASSGLPVTYVSTTPSVCTITASTANLLAAGTCGIEAKQLGNATYQPATPLGRIFTVTAH